VASSLWNEVSLLHRPETHCQFLTEACETSGEPTGCTGLERVDFTSSCFVVLAVEFITWRT
ncbi:MAG: hypothetical protein ACPIOQ_44285, partial [Promethearchaeia archaeon]